MSVRISRPLLAQILAHAQSGGAHEVCGLLFGAEGRIDAAVPVENVAADPARHFEIAPAALIAAHRAARAGGPALIGHYHSHPGGHAEPSVTDAQAAAPDGTLWMIVADGAAWLWRAGDEGLHGRFLPEALIEG